MKERGKTHEPKKTSVSLVTFALSALLIVGCSTGKQAPHTYGLSGKLPVGFIENNASILNEIALTGYSEAKSITNYDGITGSPFMNYQAVYNNLGGIRYGVYDLTGNREIVPTNYTSLSFRQVWYYNQNIKRSHAVVFVNLATMDGKQGIYNLTEDNFLVGLGDYTSLNFTVSNVTKVMVEQIDFTTVDGSESIVNHVTYNKENNIVRTQVPDLASGDTIAAPVRTTFASFPELNGMEYDLTGSYIKGYKNGKEVFTRELPRNTLVNSFAADKYYVAQQQYQVDVDSKKFTYAEGVLNITSLPSALI